MRIVSGIQPTSAVPHIGNYLGAIQNWVKLQNVTMNKCFFSIADLHALTTIQRPRAEIEHSTKQLAIALLACGISPYKSVLFVQSQVPQHTQLAWVLSCITPFGALNRMVQWKSKTEGSSNAQMGLLAYPILQAADILLYKADAVPVGNDQIQHLELTKRLATQFNSKFKTEIMQTPRPLLAQSPRIMSLRKPAQKMSKSDANKMSTIFITDDPDLIRRKIKGAVTDSLRDFSYNRDERPGLSNLIEIMSAMTGQSIDVIVKEFSSASVFKAALAEAIIEKLGPIQKEMDRLNRDHGFIEAQLSLGAQKARDEAEKCYREVCKSVGIIVTDRLTVP